MPMSRIIEQVQRLVLTAEKAKNIKSTASSLLDRTGYRLIARSVELDEFQKIAQHEGVIHGRALEMPPVGQELCFRLGP